MAYCRDFWSGCSHAYKNEHLNPSLGKCMRIAHWSWCSLSHLRCWYLIDILLRLKIISQRTAHKGRPQHTWQVPNLQHSIMGGTDQDLASETPCLGPTIWRTRRFVLLLFTEVFSINALFLSILCWQTGLLPKSLDKWRSWSYLEVKVLTISAFNCDNLVLLISFS